MKSEEGSRNAEEIHTFRASSGDGHCTPPQKLHWARSKFPNPINICDGWASAIYMPSVWSENRGPHHKELCSSNLSRNISVTLLKVHLLLLKLTKNWKSTLDVPNYCSLYKVLSILPLWDYIKHKQFQNIRAPFSLSSHPQEPII